MIYREFYARIERILRKIDEQQEKEGETIRIEFVESVHIISLFIYSKQTNKQKSTNSHTYICHFRIHDWNNYFVFLFIYRMKCCQFLCHF